MRKRADDVERMRDRIIRATLQLHDERGVASTTFAEIAQRAGVGQATVYRHYPTLGDLVRNCGVHVWQEMQPPVPDAAAALFAGLTTRRQRLRRLLKELDAFYRRGAHRLKMAGKDRDVVPELHAFLGAVEAGVEALVREALKGEPIQEQAVQAVTCLVSFPVWAEMRKVDFPAADLLRFELEFLECAIKARPRPS